VRIAEQGRGEALEDFIDTRQFAQQFGIGHEFDGTRSAGKVASGLRDGILVSVLAVFRRPEASPLALRLSF
jgi:hypothetical protein